MQQSLTVLASFLALLLVAAPAWGIKQRPGGERPSEWRKEALRGRMAREFDPTITSLGYCDPKTYPRDGKRLPAVRLLRMSSPGNDDHHHARMRPDHL